MKKYLLDYIKENSKMITIFILCITIGIVCGIIMYNFSNQDVKNGLKETVINTLDISKQENFDGINIIKNGVTTNIILILLIYFSTLTIISPIIISLLNVIKGMSIGIYIPILFSVFGISNGILALFLLLIVPNLFYIPAYLFLSTNALNLHYIIMENKGDNKLKVFMKQITFIVIGCSFIFLSILFEQILSTNIISIYKSM